MKKLGPLALSRGFRDPSWPRLGAVIAPVLVALAVWLGGTAPAHAQLDPFGWFEQFFRPPSPPSQPTHPRPEIRRAQPKSSSQRPKPSARHIEKPSEKPAEKPSVAPSYFVAVLGDSLAQMLARGLAEAFVDRPDLAVLNKARENSGLVRDDFFDWVKATQDLLASGDKIDFAVVMIGSNDRQALRDANGTLEVRSPEWVDAYAQRIEAIATAFRDKKIPLVWVGLPILKSERLAADALAFNEIFRDHAQKAGATYIDIWERFADDSGSYRASGPDISGQIVRLRAADGVHFTKAGARKLAHFIEPEIRHHLELTRPQPHPEIADLPPANSGAPPNDQAKPEPVPVKPLAGPVLPLNGPVLAPGGQLATGKEAPDPQGSNARALIDRVLIEGKAPDPQPGRADDFTWPRPAEAHAEERR